MPRRLATNMADGSQTTSVSIPVQSKANTSGSVPNSQAQTSQSSTSNTSTAAASNVDTKVRNAGASLAEFLTQLEDYTPTVIKSLVSSLFFLNSLSFFNVPFLLLLETIAIQ